MGNPPRLLLLFPRIIFLQEVDGVIIDRHTPGHSDTGSIDPECPRGGLRVSSFQPASRCVFVSGLRLEVWPPKKLVVPHGLNPFVIRVPVVGKVGLFKSPDLFLHFSLPFVPRASLGRRTGESKQQ
jgi:hypothetical protein